MNKTPNSKQNADGGSMMRLVRLADGWDAESAYLKKKSEKAWHASDNFDLKHQAETFDRCSRDLRKLLGANTPDQERKSPASDGSI